MKWLKKHMTSFEQEMFKDEFDENDLEPGINYKWEL